MTNPLSGGPFGAAWHAFYQQGIWVPTAGANGMETTAIVSNGDTSIRVNQIPDGGPPIIKTNMFEPIRSPSPGVPGAGFGKLLQLDPAGEDVGVEIRGVDPFLSDLIAGDVVIQLARPVSGLSAPLGAGALVGMGYSPVIGIGSYPKKVRLIGITHGVDARGDDNGAAGYSTAPNVLVDIYGGDNQKGPFHLIGSVPAGAQPSAPGGPVDKIQSADYTIPSIAFLRFGLSPQGGDGENTIYSLKMSFTLP